jgi:WD40 repeat protein
MLWDMNREREGRPLMGHTDIVGGCRLTPDGKRLLSWSHDGTLRLWDLDPLQPVATLTGHGDRVTAAAVSPDGRWAASGSRDGVVKLWDLETHRELKSVTAGAEVRSCFFLLDGATLVTADMHGGLAVYGVPELEPRGGLATALGVQCADLDASGSRIALGCADGRVYFVHIDGLDETPLLVTPTQTSRRTATPLQRLFGRSTVTHAFTCICPVCRHTFEVDRAVAGQPTPCPGCRRHLRLSSVLRVAQDD